MNAPSARSVIGWLIRDTFRQSLATGIFWLMLAVSVLTAGACLTVRITEASPAPARIELLNGALSLEVPHARAHPVRTLQLQLAGWVADAAGLLLALIWTAGFLPSFLEPGAVSVLLSKSAPRWILLSGKFVGVVLFVGVQTTLFIALTWLALAVRTGVWDLRYFLCIPLLILNFAVFYSFSVMLAVATRSTVACAFGSIAFWLICSAVNFGRHARLLVPGVTGIAPTFGRTLDFIYWMLPKPLDFHLMLMETLQAENLFAQFLDVRTLTEKGLWYPVAALNTSLLFGVGMLVIAAYDFLTKDY